MNTSCRAYFNFPVLAWLNNDIEQTELDYLAKEGGIKMELNGFLRNNEELFLAFSEDMKSKAEKLQNRFSFEQSSRYSKGPFEGAIGIFLAKIKNKSPALAQTAAFRSKTAILATVLLDWVQNDSMASQWTILSSARLKTLAKA